MEQKEYVLLPIEGDLPISDPDGTEDVEEEEDDEEEEDLEVDIDDPPAPQPVV